MKTVQWQVKAEMNGNKCVICLKNRNVATVQETLFTTTGNEPDSFTCDAINFYSESFENGCVGKKSCRKPNYMICKLNYMLCKHEWQSASRFRNYNYIT